MVRKENVLFREKVLQEINKQRSRIATLAIFSTNLHRIGFGWHMANALRPHATANEDKMNYSVAEILQAQSDGEATRAHIRSASCARGCPTLFTNLRFSLLQVQCCLFLARIGVQRVLRNHPLSVEEGAIQRDGRPHHFNERIEPRVEHGQDY